MNPIVDKGSANIDPEDRQGLRRGVGRFRSGPDERRGASPAVRAILFGFPVRKLPRGAEGFDLGCGTGRWAELAAEKVGALHCIDPAEKALAVARRRLGDLPKVQFHNAAVDQIPLPDESQDFGYSLGVLHHIPDTEAAIAGCTRKLKAGAPFLVYLYYAFDNRPRWFRHAMARLGDRARCLRALAVQAEESGHDRDCDDHLLALGQGCASGGTGRRRRLRVPAELLSQASFYTMRTDALDRFGTRLEQRFTRGQVEQMMRSAGLADIRFSDREPYWVAVGRKEGSGGAVPSVNDRTTAANLGSHGFARITSLDRAAGGAAHRRP